jgi:HSP20 family protein
MDRIFEGVPAGRVWPLGFLPGSAARQYPRVNVAEAHDSYRVEALAPGADPAQLDVSIKENVLTLSGVKTAPEGVEPEAFHRSERAAGRFVRSLELPGEVDVEKVKASYVDGILTLTLPKAERAKARRIEIAVG